MTDNDSVLISPEVVHGEEPVAVLWFSDTGLYHIEGPYTFAEAREVAKDGLAEAARDLPDDPPPQVQMHVLRHRKHNP